MRSAGKSRAREDAATDRNRTTNYVVRRVASDVLYFTGQPFTLVKRFDPLKDALCPSFSYQAVSMSA